MLFVFFFGRHEYVNFKASNCFDVEIIFSCGLLKKIACWEKTAEHIRVLSRY
jgi:hypothetical protein